MAVALVIPKEISLQSIVQAAWAHLTANLQSWLKVFGLLFVLGIVPFVVASVIFGEKSALAQLVQLLLNFWIIFIQLVVTKKSIDLSRGIEPTFDDIATFKDQYVPFLIGCILVGLRVMLGFILLIVPGVIWSIQFMFVPALIADKKVNYREAFQQSSAMTQGHKMQLFGYGLAFSVVNILASMLFFLPVIITGALSVVSYIAIYRAFCDKTSTTPVAA